MRAAFDNASHGTRQARCAVERDTTAVCLSSCLKHVWTVPAGCPEEDFYNRFDGLPADDL